MPNRQMHLLRKRTKLATIGSNSELAWKVSTLEFSPTRRIRNIYNNVKKRNSAARWPQRQLLVQADCES
ncbi:hypothetical protein PHMEG_0007699 [Phytophthora megakarya]|uniref:Uncharacterized protein n=1 Tax=Phytophthora megakarya TaxID=4795 RepID=A0A225WKS2_9STRA|nr:hypothetical protein PHMEG_0007699 [Phytophthora megakarya]